MLEWVSPRQCISKLAPNPIKASCNLVKKRHADSQDSTPRRGGPEGPFHLVKYSILQTCIFTLLHFCKPTFCQCHTFANLLAISQQNHTHCQCHHWIPQYKLPCQKKLHFLSSIQERILRCLSVNYMAQGRLATQTDSRKPCKQNQLKSQTGLTG